MTPSDDDGGNAAGPDAAVVAGWVADVADALGEAPIHIADALGAITEGAPQPLKTYTDAHGVERFGSVLDIGDAYLRCLAFGHHWDPGPVVERPGYGGVVWTVRAQCDCGRIRIDVLSPTTAELHGRDYSGGCGFLPGADVTRQEARAEWARRARARHAQIPDITGGRRRGRS